jgi:hypothetical protein
MMKMNQLVVLNWQQNNAGVLFRNPITSTVLIIVRGYIEKQLLVLTYWFCRIDTFY